jgi:hypothetical protein
MGWAGIAAVQSEVPDAETRKRIYQPIFDAFRSEDWDTVSECLGEDEAFDAVAKRRQRR